MNKRTAKSVERRILKSMREDEIQLKLLLGTETNGIPDYSLAVELAA